MKKCTTCKIEKELSEFSKHNTSKDGLFYYCKSCSKERIKKWREANKEHEKQYRESNKKRIKKYREDNKNSKIEYDKKYREANKERINEYARKWKKYNKERVRGYRKKWREDNQEHQNQYHKQRRQEDPMYKLKCNLRSRTYKAFKNKGYSKNTKTQDMLGVDWEVAKQYIERQFKKGMNWENQGDWHIDHIIPLASANTPERLKKLCHYTNLQPMWAVDNLIKSDSIIGQQTLLRI